MKKLIIGSIITTSIAVLGVTYMLLTSSKRREECEFCDECKECEFCEECELCENCPKDCKSCLNCRLNCRRRSSIA